MGNGKSKDNVVSVQKNKEEVNWNGNLKKHKYTDICCLVIFVVFLIIWAVIGVVSILQGDITKVEIYSCIKISYTIILSLSIQNHN